MITLTKTINKLPKNPLLKTNKGEHRFKMNIKTRTGNHQQASPQGPPFYHFLEGGGGQHPGLVESTCICRYRLVIDELTIELQGCPVQACMHDRCHLIIDDSYLSIFCNHVAHSLVHLIDLPVLFLQQSEPVPILLTRHPFTVPRGYTYQDTIYQDTSCLLFLPENMDKEFFRRRRKFLAFVHAQTVNTDQQTPNNIREHLNRWCAERTCEQKAHTGNSRRGRSHETPKSSHCTTHSIK